MDYEATNKTCFSTPKLFGFVPLTTTKLPERRTVFYDAEIQNGSYVAKFPAQAYTGPCNWTPRTWEPLIGTLGNQDTTINFHHKTAMPGKYVTSWIFPPRWEGKVLCKAIPEKATSFWYCHTTDETVELKANSQSPIILDFSLTDKK